ncbi:MAG: hypothetical protein KA419_00790 [Acidobacteria bacterium]|nr:hypothetical protein [Acidobacteriota bacterium]
MPRVLLRSLTFAVLLAALLPELFATAPTAPGPGPRYPQEFVLKPLKLLPASLRAVMTLQQAAILDSYRSVPDPGPEAVGGALAAEVEAALRTLTAEKPSMDDLAKRFGRIAGLTARFADVSRFGEGLEAGWFADFARYRNSCLHKYVAVFYDHSPLLFVDGDVGAYLEETRARCEKYARMVAGIYREGGDSSTFDDLSPAFGISALHYSHTITDVANLWLYCWWKSGGDMTNTPYYTPPPAPATGKTEEEDLE